MDAAEAVGLDPTVPAPPMTVPYNPNLDAVGHGRELPLIGGQRTHQLDVLVEPLLRGDHKRVRIYADNAAGVLSELIPNYAPYAAALDTAIETGDRDSVEDAFVDAFLARWRHATLVRVALQNQLNNEAHTAGVWAALTDEQRTQCAQAAEGLIPVGVIEVHQMDDADGHPIDVEVPVWDSLLIPLVVNRGDYGLYSDDDVTEPTADVSVRFTDDETGGVDITIPVVIVLDPTDDDTYVASLQDAGLLSIEFRPVLPISSLYLNSMLLGQAIEQGRVVEGGTTTFADLAELYPDRYDNPDTVDYDGAAGTLTSPDVLNSDY